MTRYQTFNVTMRLIARYYVNNLRNFHFYPFQFQLHVSRWHQLLCELISFELKPELRALLRKIFLRVGHVFQILSP